MAGIALLSTLMSLTISARLQSRFTTRGIGDALRHNGTDFDQYLEGKPNIGQNLFHYGNPLEWRSWMALEIESLVLLFWIQGGGSNHVFAIRLGPSDSVVELKEAIRKKNSKVSAPAILNLGRWVHCFGIRR